MKLTYSSDVIGCGVEDRSMHDKIAKQERCGPHGSIFTGMAGGSGMERLSCIMHGPREREEQKTERKQHFV